MSTLPQLSYKIDQMESLFNIPPLKEGKRISTETICRSALRNVRFSYRKGRSPPRRLLLCPQGALTALVGRIRQRQVDPAKLLVHYYDVTDGRITLGARTWEMSSAL